MNIAAMLEEQARQAGARVAIAESGDAVTFAELDRAVAVAAGRLRRAGLESGMRALIFSRMSIDLYVTLIALFRLRVTAVFVDPSAGRRRLDMCIRRVRPQAFVAIPRAHLLRLTSAAVRDIPIKIVVGGRIPFAGRVSRTGGEAHPVEPCAPETPAIITFTSGSTGEPKAAVRTHGFLVAQHRALVEAIALAPGQIDLCTLPIFLLANLASGLTSVIPDADLRAPGSIDPDPVLAQIEQWRPDRVVASPAFLLRLAGRCRARGVRLDSFNRMYTGGAPVFPSMLDAIADAAPRASVVAVYGSTEAEPIAEIDRLAIGSADREAMMRGAGLLAGRPVESVQLRILEDRWGTPIGPLTLEDLVAQSKGPQQPGEIVVSGEHVLDGYLDGRGNEDTKIAVDGRVWHRTGDAGYLDEAGRLWLLGRCSARSAGPAGVLYPFTVECAASGNPGVSRSALVQHKGQRVLAIELRPGEGDPSAALRTALAWAQIDRIVVLPEIPVDTRHNAKVDYPALLERIERT